MKIPGPETVTFWNGVLVVAMVAIAGTAIYDLIAPPINTDRATAEVRHAIEATQSELITVAGELDVLEGQVGALAWTGDLDSLSPTVIEQVNARASEAGVEIAAFRPQRAIEGERLNMISFLVSATGKFPDVVALVDALGEPESQLAVRQVRIGAADEETGDVDATIGLVAYVIPPEVPSG